MSAHNNMILPLNSGSIGGTTYANPASVPAGVLACFDLDGNGSALNAAAPAGGFQLVLGTATGPIVSSPIYPSKLTTTYKAYVAPTLSTITIDSIPVGPTGGATYGIKVLDVSRGVYPLFEKSFEAIVPASQAIEVTLLDFVTQMESSLIENDRFNAKTNKTMNASVTGTSGTANITVSNGLVSYAYLVTFDTNVNTTAANFVTAHAATILAQLGITVTNPSAANLLFTLANGVTGNVTITVANASGDLSATLTTPQAATQLILTAQDYDIFLDVAFQEYLSGIAVKTITAAVTGSGNGAKVYELERLSLSNRGRFYMENAVLGSLPAMTQYVNAALNYNIYSLSHKNNTDIAIARAFEHQVIHVPLATGVTGDLDTFFGL